MKNLIHYQNLVGSLENIVIKGKKTQYTSTNGYMFSFLSPEGKVGIRLSKEDREEFLIRFKANLMVQYEKVMKEFVEVPSNILPDTKILSEYLKRSLSYTSSLKPK